MNSKSGKIYLLATIKYTWCAYLPPPFTGISHYSSLRNLTWHSYLVYLWFYKLFQWSSYALPHFSRIINLLHIIILVTWQAWHIQIQRWIDLRITKRWGFFPLLISIKTFQEVLYSENWNVQIHQWFLCRRKSKNVYKSQFDWQATYLFS